MLTTLAALLISVGLAGNAATVTGTWNMGLQGDHVIPTALVLKQEGKNVTGTIALPTQNIGQRVEVALTGSFDENALKLSGQVENAREPTTIQIDGHFGDEGMLEGTIIVHGRSIPWTAERLKERK
jgi:hypothetical protein